MTKIKKLFKLNETIKALVVFALFCTFWTAGIIIKFEIPLFAIVPFIIYVVFLLVVNRIIK